jgi:hypothetical protein
MPEIPFLYTKLGYNNTKILRFFLASQTIFLLPFIITSLALINTVSSDCLLANFMNRSNPDYFGIFTLGQWVAMDGYIKLAVWFFVVFLNAL